MFGAPVASVKKDDDAGAKPWQGKGVRGANSASQLRGMLLGVLVLVLLGLIVSVVGRGLSGDGANVAGDNVTSSRVSAQRPQTKSTLAVANSSPDNHSTGSADRPVGSSSQRPAGGSSTGAKLKTPKKVFVTEELSQYASLITDEVLQAWALMEADQGQAMSAFTAQQSEFYAALTMLSLNVSTVCELGAADGRSAITWLEALPWTQVYSFSRAQVPDDGGGQQDGSFGPPPMEASGEPRTGTRAPTAPSTRQVLSRTYLQQTYGTRYRWLQLNSISASELQQVAEEQSIDKCDVIVISADQEEAPVALHNGGPSVDISTPLPSLKADLMAMRQLATGWHFLLVDGMGCSDWEAAQAAATGVDKTSAAPAPGVGGLLRGPSSTDSSTTPVLPGRRERTAGGCIYNEASPPVPLAAAPQRVRATWEAVVSEGVVVEYECRTGESNPPGWCLGTYRATRYNSMMMAGASWLKHNGMVGAAAGGATDDGPRSLSWISSEGMYLNVGDQLKSEHDEFYLEMQEDGNLVIYHTHGDADDSAKVGREEPKAVWSSRTSGPVGNYFLSLEVNMSGCHPSRLSADMPLLAGPAAENYLLRSCATV